MRRIGLVEPPAKANDADDIAAVRRSRAHEDAMGGYEAAKCSYYSAEEAKQLLNGASPLRIWRQKRSLTQHALAQAAGLQTGYLRDVETAKQPGSDLVLKALAQVIDIPMDYLIA